MFDEIKVFSVTMHRDRDQLGELITDWISEHHAEFEIVDKEVRQSSDKGFHCLSIVLFLRRRQS